MPSIDLSEVHALARDIRRNADETPAKTERVIAEGARRVVAEMRGDAPVLTGRLRASSSADVEGLRFEAGPTARYGEYVELGTSEMAAEPFAGPAFDQELPGIEAALAEVGADILGRR